MRGYFALRIDDVGASSKKYEIYGNTWIDLGKFGITFPLANFLWFKYIRPFKKWGPYRELNVGDWSNILKLLTDKKAKLTVAVTATWVEGKKKLTPFFKKFPQQAQILKEGLRMGLIEIANHGLTHCVEKDNLFKPKLFSSNRQYHREFWDWIMPDVQEEHIRRSQEMLQGYFNTEIVTFVPPGNVFQDETLRIARKYGIRYVSCNTPRRIFNDMVIIGNDNVFAFHDREIVLNDINWLEKVIELNREKKFLFVKEVGRDALKN